MTPDPTETGTTFGERIRFYRQKRGMSQDALAAEVGRGHAMLSMLERGQRQIHVDELVTFARALQVPTAALLGSEDGDLYAVGFEQGYAEALHRVRDAVTEIGASDDG